MEEKVLSALQKWNTPTVYNGWEAVTKHSRLSCFNKAPVTQFTPEKGPMAGYAVTVVIEPGEKSHTKNLNAWDEYRKYVTSIKGPKIVVVQDLDSPNIAGAFWGEVNTNIHLSLGCVGTITDGGLRDIDEIRSTPFNAVGKALCVGHAYSYPVRWGCDVEVFGTTVHPGQLVHCDQHGFLAIPPEDQDKLLEAVEYLDFLERSTVIAAALGSRGKESEQVLNEVSRADREYRCQYSERFVSKTSDTL
ncbi:MAG: RraA family protein [Sphaerochaetaceae bacterium]|nr:RraA family protein [Sphaerochaetaceae bacterium]